VESYEKKVYSQNGEDGIIEYIFNSIGVTNKIAVEFGVNSSEHGAESNTRLLLDKGWKTFWIDTKENSGIHENCVSIQRFLTVDNIVDTFKELKIPIEFDLLSIDIDGNDYHIREALSEYKPRVYIIEYNGAISADSEYVMPRNDNYVWNGGTDFGASLLSYTKQADRLGYDLVYCNSNGVNSFFIKRDINPFPKVTVQEVWRKLFWA